MHLLCERLKGFGAAFSQDEKSILNGLEKAQNRIEQLNTQAKERPLTLKETEELRTLRRLPMDIEYQMSKNLYDQWKASGTVERPLTPYEKLFLKDQFPDLNFDSIRLNNDKNGFLNKILMKMNSSGAMAGYDTIYRLSPRPGIMDPNRNPGGFNPFDSDPVKNQQNLSLLAHEVTHIAQHRNGVIPYLGFFARYGAEYFGFSKDRNYGTAPFNDVTVSQVGQESGMFYQGNYTTYDNRADMNQMISWQKYNYLYGTNTPYNDGY